MSPPIIYIASAYSGDIETNVTKTKGYSRYVIQSGCIPLNPILNLHGVLDEESDRDTAIGIDLSLLERCDELWVFGEPTAGMKKEIAEAQRQKKPIRYVTGGCSNDSNDPCRAMKRNFDEGRDRQIVLPEGDAI